MDNLYIEWNNKCLEISKDNIPHWKRCSEVCHMLEHVAGSHTIEYIKKLLKEGISKETIQEYATLCDSVGDPYVYNFEGIRTSTTCIRYLYHANEIAKINNTQLQIVEIGGGYGGLALAVNFISKLKNIKIPKYSILDLSNVQELQKYYLSKFKLSFQVEYPKMITTPFFLVSNYALSEMGEQYRNKYITDIILPNAQSGFLVWNSSASYEDSSNKFDCKCEKEDPQTGPDNSIIIFKKKDTN